MPIFGPFLIRPKRDLNIYLIVVGNDKEWMCTKITINTITPSDIENLVSCAQKKENGLFRDGRGLTFANITWALSVLGVASISYHFFKEILGENK